MTARRKPKPKNGGKRKPRSRAGRPAKAPEDKRSVSYQVLVTPAESRLFEAKVAAENAEVDDGKPATVTSWLRDLGREAVGLAYDENNDGAIARNGDLSAGAAERIMARYGAEEDLIAPVDPDEGSSP